MPIAARDRPVHDEQRRRHVRRRLHAVQVEGRLGQRQQRGAHDRRVFRLAAGHHQVDRQHLAGQAAVARRHPAFDEIRLAAERRDHGVDRVAASAARPAARRSSPARNTIRPGRCRPALRGSGAAWQLARSQPAWRASRTGRKSAIRRARLCNGLDVVAGSARSARATGRSDRHSVAGATPAHSRRRPARRSELGHSRDRASTAGAAPDPRAGIASRPNTASQSYNRCAQRSLRWFEENSPIIRCDAKPSLAPDVLGVCSRPRRRG